jgi:hypothetical protein
MVLIKQWPCDRREVLTMRSPFPGMDPYIEDIGVWEDFHLELISSIKGAISAALPERYVVLAGERSYVVLATQDGDVEFLTSPDVAVAKVAGSTLAAGQRADERQTAAVLEETEPETAPITMRALTEGEYREAYLEIYELRPERRLVTCIEALSPSNKRYGSPGWLQYVRKRQAYLAGAANFVEIDLLRGGRRMPMVRAWPESPYYTLVCRKKEAPDCQVWKAHYLRPLPQLPIPLATPDPDITIALQPLIDAVYARSHYDRLIDYQQPLNPPLTVNESQWLLERMEHK